MTTQSAEAGLLGEACVGCGLLPAQKGSAQLRVVASVRGQQLQENHAQCNPDRTPGHREREAGDHSHQAQCRVPVFSGLHSDLGLRTKTAVPWPGALG